MRHRSVRDRDRLLDRRRGALGLVGAGLHLFYYKPALDTLRIYETGAPGENRQLYDQELPIWRTHRAVTIGAYCLAAATIAAGVVLRYTVYAEPEPGGGSVVVGMRW